MCVRSVPTFGTAALCGGVTSVITGRKSVFTLRTCMSSKHVEMILFMRSAKFRDEMLTCKFNLWSAFKRTILTLGQRPDFCNVNSGWGLQKLLSLVDWLIYVHVSTITAIWTVGHRLRSTPTNGRRFTALSLPCYLQNAFEFCMRFSSIGRGAQANFCCCLLCSNIISHAHKHSKWQLTERVYLDITIRMNN